ncbi:MAG: hypothetical protein LBO20_05510 [Bifidobacteriaceae bacterium]|nr:hypothetical protein [Bifidobacteriaceae bacterium]
MKATKDVAAGRGAAIRFGLVLTTIVAICLAAFFEVCLPQREEAVQAVAGRIDLRQIAFTDKPAALDGQWEFHWGELLTPADFDQAVDGSGAAAEATYIDVPSTWDKSGYPLYGHATYRLTILTDEPELAMLVPEISDSARVWANGAEVFRAGNPGVDAASTISSVRNEVVNLWPDSAGQVELVVQAANYGWWASGLRYAFEAGPPAVLLGEVIPRRVVLGGFIGLVAAMFLYHIMIFAVRPKERVYLLFALTCLAIAVRFSVESNGLASMFAPDGVDLWLTYVYLGSVVGQTAALTFFTHAVFDIPVAAKWRRAVYALCLAGPLTLVCLLPYGAVNTQIVYLAILPLAMAFVSAARRAKVRDNPFNLLYLIVVGVMLFWYPAQKILLTDALFMPGVVTSLFLVLSQCVMLSMGYAAAKRREAELLAANRLYLRVSHELMTPITVVSTNIQVANLAEATDHARLEDSQAEIIRMKEMVERILESETGAGGEDVGQAGADR